MTNPNNTIGTNGAFGGRTSANAFNDIMGAFQSRGVLSGWGIAPSSGMTVSVGGDGTVRDVAVAEDASGNKTSVNNISGSPVQVTLDSAPASNARFDAIVVYVDKPPVNSNATQDNPECCGIIPVSGTAASSPAYPDDGAIRSAITADGASGATAYYAVVGYVRVASGTTAITSAMITAGAHPTTNAMVQTGNIAAGAVTSDKIDWTTFESTIDLMPYKTSLVQSGNATVRRKSGIAIVNMSLTVKSGTTGEQNLFSLPTGVRPKDAPAVFSAASTTGAVLMVRTKGNNIALNFTTTNALGVLATGSYIYE